jgi:2-phosphoglycerate kinase
MTTPTVILIGGASGAGKTTLASALASRLGSDSMSADDLFIAAKTFTTPHTHPGMHVMNVPNYIDYFTNSTVDKLTADATEQHQAFWPVIERVIRFRLLEHRPIVIDGWFFRPKWISELNLDNVRSFWLVADSQVLEKREREQGTWERSSNPEQMIQNHLGRSYWYNDLIRRQAEELGSEILHQDGTVSVDSLCDTIVDRLEQEG